ncbi:hypothetical protein CQ14_21275 [Bradyrhizobium lablabi]|uniref:Virulence-associated protein E-like domain-containing protein n=1 Tax=Bradyrhizobium lablabi TaxID=722472 RepID=A0A0R3N1N1_9BRAD|nr:primase-helicase family protein [Bradyrhizobium lablabi]KRR26210.1 hypothetical protein CQ14_21275 [Bradyrhizobium lablabi]
MREIPVPPALLAPSNVRASASIPAISHAEEAHQQASLARFGVLTDNDVDVENATGFVRNYMNVQGIEVLFNGTLSLHGRSLQAMTPDDIDDVLAVDPPSFADLLDEMVLAARDVGSRLKRTELSSALRQVVRAQRKSRQISVLRPLLNNCSPEELAQAKTVWRRIGDLFDMQNELAIAVLQHFCWSVKQKQLGRPVLHHCMPIIFSTTQGTGKTVFVKKFLSPLRELASDTALFTDLADRRSGEIFRFPVILLDDMESIPAAMVPVLKQVLTSDHLQRRKLGTSLSVSIRQAGIPIGTSNRMIHELVEDDTGHRRFAMLPFRNGAVAKGGDATVWDTVNAINYELLWRSIDAFAPSPLLPYRADLQRHEDGASSKGGMLGWLIGLDLESEAVRNLTTLRGLRAQELRDLFQVQTGIEMSAQRFASEMQRYLLRPDTPFGDKIRTEHGALYRLKRKVPDGNPIHQDVGQRMTVAEVQMSAPASSGPSSSSSSSASSGPSGSSADVGGKVGA